MDVENENGARPRRSASSAECAEPEWSLDDPIAERAGLMHSMLHALGSRVQSMKALAVWASGLFASLACVQWLQAKDRMAFGQARLFAPASRETMAATLVFSSHLLLPWAALAWRQLRPRPGNLRRWQPVDAMVVLIIWFNTIFGTACVLGARASSETTTLLLAGTSIFGLVGLTTIVLINVRVVFAFLVLIPCLSVYPDQSNVWAWEPLVGRVACCLGASASIFSGFSPPVLRRVELPVSGLPEEADGYTICHLSDLHAGPISGVFAIDSLASQLQNIFCDAIVLNGDIAEGLVELRAPLMEALLPSLQSARDGAFFVLGNHEFYNIHATDGGLAGAVAWGRWWHNHSVTWLNNTWVGLPTGASKPWFALAGVDDYMGSPQLDSALPRGQEFPVVLLAHRPSFAMEAAEKGVAVQLSGHTHAGQLWPFHVLAARASHGLLSGVYRVKDLWLYVSDGTFGSYWMRLRLFTSNEISQVVLRSASLTDDVLLATRGAEIGLLLAYALALLAAVATLLHAGKMAAVWLSKRSAGNPAVAPVPLGRGHLEVANP